MNPDVTNEIEAVEDRAHEFLEGIKKCWDDSVGGMDDPVWSGDSAYSQSEICLRRGYARSIRRGGWDSAIDEQVSEASCDHGKQGKRVRRRVCHA